MGNSRNIPYFMKTASISPFLKMLIGLKQEMLKRLEQFFFKEFEKFIHLFLSLCLYLVSHLKLIPYSGILT